MEDPIVHPSVRARQASAMLEMDELTEYVAGLIEDKCDPELGRQVQMHLYDKGLVPKPEEDKPYKYNPRIAVQQLAQGIHSGLSALGLDMDNNPSLKDTPRRYATMLVGELTKGLNFNFFPKFTVFPAGEHNQMVFLGKIETMSLCEHHLQTIDGYTYVAYLPGKSMCGISKLARVVEFFARRPQVQETMTEQIFAALKFCLGTEDVAVVQECVHYCMRARGSKQHSTIMHTNRMGGKFMMVAPLREEFLQACRAHS
jgi:GTP cyclohydrolase I